MLDTVISNTVHPTTQIIQNLNSGIKFSPPVQCQKYAVKPNMANLKSFWGVLN